MLISTLPTFTLSVTIMVSLVILNIIQPSAIDDILSAPRHYHDPSQVQPPFASFLHTPHCCLCLSYGVVIPSSSTPYIPDAIKNLVLPFSTPCNNSMTPPQFPLYGPASIPVLVTPWQMPYSKQPFSTASTSVSHIPVGMTCTCAGHPTIDTVGDHLLRISSL